jgi:predicted MFS family arabinose efflux permease
VPIAGIIAGFALPFLMEQVGLPATILILMVITVLSTLAVQPVRDQLDGERDSHQPLNLRIFLAPSNVLAPFRTLVQTPRLLPMSFIAFCNSIGQSVLFAYLITYMVSDLHYALRTAGTVFAVLQVSGIVGRLALGWLTDRLDASNGILRISSLTSALTIACLAFSASDWPVWAFFLIASVGGIACCSWAGICLAEVARAAPRHQVSEATSGVTLIYYIGYVIGPLVFAALLSLSGSYRIDLLIVATLTALGALGSAAQKPEPA